MKSSLCWLGVMVLTGCTTMRPSSLIEPSSSSAGSLVMSDGCYWLVNTNGSRQEVDTANPARIINSASGLKFVGTDGVAKNFGTYGNFIAGEAGRKGKCSDENIILIHRALPLYQRSELTL